MAIVKEDGMDTKRFDAMTSALCAGANRRRALASFAGGALAGLCRGTAAKDKGDERVCCIYECSDATTAQSITMHDCIPFKNPIECPAPPDCPGLTCALLGIQLRTKCSECLLGQRKCPK
jgi:hypothetical protein